MLTRSTLCAAGLAAVFVCFAAARTEASVSPSPAPPSACAVTAAVAAVCYDLDVVCEGISPRRARVRQLDVAPGVPVVGNVLFTTGNTGRALYGAPGTPERLTTVLVMHANGYRTFEVNWIDGEGWQSGAFGFGWTGALCAYAEVVKYLADPAPAGGGKMPETNLGGLLGKNIRAEGNSGGGAQIAYGMTNYGLEAYLSVVVYSAGPPISDFYGACFGAEYDKDASPAGLGLGLGHPGRLIIDKAVSFYNPADVEGFNYCVNFPRPPGDVGSGVLPPTSDVLNADSLVSSGPLQLARNYSAPYTCSRFVAAEFDATGAQNQGLLFFDRVRPNQPFTTTRLLVPGLEAHETDATPPGASAVRGRLLAACQPVAMEADACQAGGWQLLHRPDGTTFRNQGDCIQFVNTGK